MHISRVPHSHTSTHTSEQLCSSLMSRSMRPTPWFWSRSFHTRVDKSTSAQSPLVDTPSTSSVDKSSLLSLNNIRESLIRQEDTIIFNLIERAQFAFNEPVYRSDCIPVPGFKPDGTRYSPLEYLLRETEQLHGKMRRFTSPDEHPFYPDALPPLVLPPILYKSVLAPYTKDINVNGQIKELYLTSLLPRITAAGDDNNYGSAALNDVIALQALSKRIHYGKFVAEAKFLAQREEYTAAIKAGDREGITQLLTNFAVEKQVVARVRRKAATFGQDYTAEQEHESDGSKLKVDPEVVADLFQTWVIPLTKDVEVDYLLRRLEWTD